MKENVVILGATSGIARPLAQLMAARGCRLILAGRNLEQLERDAADVRLRYRTEVFVESFDALDDSSHSQLVERCTDRFAGTLEGVVLCYGLLTDQSDAQKNSATLRQTIDVNFTSAAALLELFAARLIEQKRHGYLAAISSVAGDRGRQSNYAYGAAKAGLSAYLQGLRNRLFQHGIHVLTIKPGFVDTEMTQGRVDPRSPLVASPKRVARDIDRAIRRRRNVIYTPWFWGIIMGVIRLIPESLFKRLRL
jgi:decaprenylphospho-beta-D-erythro-pentofuranosid-2-ulose 2-reductase